MSTKQPSIFPKSRLGFYGMIQIAVGILIQIYATYVLITHDNLHAFRSGVQNNPTTIALVGLFFIISGLIKAMISK